MISHAVILSKLRQERVIFGREMKTPEMLMFLRGLSHAIAIVENYADAHAIQIYEGPLKTNALLQTIASALNMLQRHQIGMAKRRLAKIVGTRIQ